MTASAQTSSGYNLILTTAPGTVTITSWNNSGFTESSFNGAFGTGGSWQLLLSGQLLASGLITSATVNGGSEFGSSGTLRGQTFTAILGGTNAGGDIQIGFASTANPPPNNYVYGSVQYQTASPVPEPTSIALLGSGVLALGRTVKRRLAAKKQSIASS